MTNRSRTGRMLRDPRIHFLGAVLIVAALVGVYRSSLYPWFMNWGATPEEQALTLPGDNLAQPGSARLTRAITIQAPPEQVWPWLLQIGQDRAGFYSNDWLENIFLAGMKNGNEIRPEWQHRALGDAVLMTRPDYLGGRLGDFTKTFIRVLEPGYAIGEAPGVFILQPTPDGGTRLLLRENSLLSDAVAWDPMHFVMERGMLLGIKARAEGRPDRPAWLDGLAKIGWAGGFMTMLGLFFRRPRWMPWAVVPLLAGMPISLTTGDLNAVFAGAMAAGIPVLGALAFGWRWPAPLLLLTAAVFLTFLLVPDSYVAFGLVFLALAATAITIGFRQIRPAQQSPATAGSRA